MENYSVNSFQKATSLKMKMNRGVLPSDSEIIALAYYEYNIGNLEAAKNVALNLLDFPLSRVVRDEANEVLRLVLIAKTEIDEVFSEMSPKNIFLEGS